MSSLNPRVAKYEGDRIHRSAKLHLAIRVRGLNALPALRIDDESAAMVRLEIPK